MAVWGIVSLIGIILSAKDNPKMGLKILGSAWSGNIAGILMWAVVGTIAALYFIGKWIAKLWTRYLTNKVASGQVQSLSDLVPSGLVGFTITHALSHFTFYSMLMALDPSADYTAFSFWSAAIYAGFIWIKVASDVRQFWETEDVYVPVEQGPGAYLSQEGGTQEPKTLFRRLFDQVRQSRPTVKPRAQSDPEDWDDDFFDF